VSEAVGTYHSHEHVKRPGRPVYWMREDHNVQERMDVLGEEGRDLVSWTPYSEGEFGGVRVQEAAAVAVCNAYGRSAPCSGHRTSVDQGRGTG
jgi:hypothetical protein